MTRDAMMRSMGRSLTRLRVERGTSARQVAGQMGVTSSTVANWEHGATQPTLGQLMRLADYYGVSLAEAMGRCDVRVVATVREVIGPKCPGQDAGTTAPLGDDARC